MKIYKCVFRVSFNVQKDIVYAEPTKADKGAICRNLGLQQAISAETNIIAKKKYTRPILSHDILEKISIINIKSQNHKISLLF